MTKRKIEQLRKQAKERAENELDPQLKIEDPTLFKDLTDNIFYELVDEYNRKHNRNKRAK